MSWLEALILGLIQGLTEYLPVSSSGHLAIGSALFGIQGEENLAFTIVVHVATVCSTLVILWKEIDWIFRGLFKFRMNEETRYVINILISMIPIGIVGVFFKDYVEEIFGSGLLIVGCMLLLTAALLTFSYYYKPRQKEKISMKDALIIGIAQAANIPASKELMPLAVAANVGGTITMIGTPPNVIVTGALSAAGLPSFGFFEFALIGVPLSVIVLAYMLTIGRKTIPIKSAGAMDADAVEAAKKEAGASDDNAPKSKTKMWISGLILLGVVAAMALNLKTVPLQTAAVTGAILCVITGCLKEKEAYAGIDWVTIFLFAGMLSVATAMDKTGAGKLIADTVVGMMGENPNPIVLCAVLYLISNVLTQFMSNTASAALLAPIGISIAQSIGADPKPVLMSIGIAASMAFATPMATPPNTLVLGPGGFSFNDYVKVGVPLCIITFIVSVIIIPIFWPFFPG